MSLKRILAILSVVILMTMYLATLVLAFVSFPGSDRILTGLVLLDISLPIFFYILIYIYNRFRP